MMGVNYTYLFIQIITHAGRYRDIDWGICKKISKHMHRQQPDTSYTHDPTGDLGSEVIRLEGISS